MMAIAEGTGLFVRSIVATANAIINPPTIIIAAPVLFARSVIRASFHARSSRSSPILSCPASARADMCRYACEPEPGLVCQSSS